SSDTLFTFGSDTVYAFLVPGHTNGSAAYLFRGVLFVGDALSYSTSRGLKEASTVFSADLVQSRASIISLWERVQRYDVKSVCTAHAKCTEFTERIDLQLD
ncbi:MAG: hypothetical protein M3483_06825, partial [Gemmatimonadota bacterium]|nr:hypothetical protein [Gemmatimonadota bacterium]